MLTRLRLLWTLVALVAVSAFAASALASSTKTVKIADSSFSAKKITIHKGQKVSWDWTGYLDHNVTVKSGPAKFHSKTQVRGVFTHRFTRKGVYHLECTIHPFMKMTVVVK
jgi:plastocyanin